VEAWIAYVRNLVPETNNDALIAGTAFHAFLEGWYSGKTVEESIEMMVSAYLAENPSEITEDYRNLDYLKGKALAYVERWKNDPLHILSTEYTFALDIKVNEEISFTYAGRIDMVAEWDDLKLVVDHKTTSRLGSTYFNQHKNSLQFPGYVYAQEENTGEIYHGCLINAVRFARNPDPSRDYRRDIISVSPAGLDIWLSRIKRGFFAYLRICH